MLSAKQLIKKIETLEAAFFNYRDENIDWYTHKQNTDAVNNEKIYSAIGQGIFDDVKKAISEAV